MLLWTLYLVAADLRGAVRDRYTRLAAQPDRGDMNISKAIYAALAVGLGAVLVAAITAAVSSRVGAIK